MSRYVSSTRERTVVWGGARWGREVTAAQESAGVGFVEVAAAAVTLWREGGGSNWVKVEARGSELRRPACLAWAMSSVAVAAWAERALGFSARVSAIVAAAEASSSAMEASRPLTIVASPWRRW